MDKLDKLVAIDAIKQLFHRRLRYMDTRQWHLYADLHTEDAVSETYGEGTQVVGHTAIAEAIEAFMTGPPEITSIHQAHNPDINFISATEAEGIWPMEDRLYWQNGDVEEWLHGWGHYHERYRKVGDTWLISYRRLSRLRVDMSPGFIQR